MFNLLNRLSPVAYGSFLPNSQQQAVAQWAVAGLQNRKGYARPRSIGRRTALLAIKRANAVKRAASNEWQAISNSSL